MANTGCLCKEWAENIEKTTAPAAFYYQRFGISYDGIPFKYCPWCAAELNFKRKEEEMK